MSKVYFVSFASSDMKSALERIGRQAREFDFFDRIFLYTEKNLPQYAKKSCRQILEKTGTRRGYAYWCWKPVIINKMLSKMDDGDILVYSDAGTHMNPNGKQKLEDEYIRLARENDIWVVRLEDSFPDVNWTKIDTLNYFRDKIADGGNREDFDRQLHEGQLESGTVIAVKSDYTVRIMREWEEYMSPEKLHLFDDSPSSAPESENFCENRHDQSILSLLLKSNHYATTHSRHFYSEDDYKDSGGGWKIIRETEPFMHLRDLPHLEKEESLSRVLKEKIRVIIHHLKTKAKSMEFLKKQI